jgi:hypothetical protein
MVIVLALVLSVGRPVTAQGAAGLTASLHQGTCADIGAVAFELTGVGAATEIDGSPVPAQESIGAPDPIPVLQSATSIEASLTDLTEAPHALVVSEAGGRTSRVIACGEVGGLLTMQMAGMVMPGDELAIALRPVGDFGYAGIALLTADGLTTTVRIYLADGLGADAP